MKKVKRFWWIKGPSGRVLHMKTGNTSEGLTECGIFAAKGWSIIRDPIRIRVRPKCKRCVK